MFSPLCKFCGCKNRRRHPKRKSAQQSLLRCTGMSIPGTIVPGGSTTVIVSSSCSSGTQIFPTEILYRCRSFLPVLESAIKNPTHAELNSTEHPLFQSSGSLSLLSSLDLPSNRINSQFGTLSVN